MTRKIFFLIVPILVLLGLSFLGYKTYRVMEKKKQARQAARQLPKLDFEFLNPLVIRNGIPVLVIFFSPDCDHCQYMTKKIVEHHDEFKEVQLIMIAPATKAGIQQFANEYDLNKLKDVNLGMDTNFKFFKIFGSTMTPSFFVYNRQHVLVKSIQGETKLSNILSLIK